MRILGVLLAGMLCASCATINARLPAGEEPIDADRPHVGTGTHLVDPGDVQLEIGAQQERDAGERRFASPVLARVGTTDWLELRFGSDGIVGRRGAEDAQGIGNVQLSAKLPLIRRSDDPLLSVMPVVTVGTASTSKGLGAGSTDSLVVFMTGREVAPWMHV